MAKILLLGDSNIANNLQHQAVIGTGQFDFKKCTTKGLFIDKILAAQTDFIVMAGIDCVVNEALTAPRESERCISLVLNNVVSKIVEKLEEETSSGTVIAVASPLYWGYFSEDVRKSLQATFKQIRRDWKHKIKFIPPCPGLKFLPDQIHLDELSGVRYTNHIIKKSCSLAKINPNPATNPSWADDVELEQMDEEEMEQDESQNSQPAAGAGTVSNLQSDPRPSTMPNSMPISNSLHSHYSANSLVSHQSINPPPIQLPSLSQFSQMVPPPIHQITMPHPHSSQVLPAQVFPVQSLLAQGPNNIELVQRIEQLIKRVETEEDKAFYDNLMFAALQEDQDDVANKGNLDRVTVTGVKIKDFHKAAENEKPPMMRAAIAKIIEFVTPEAENNENNENNARVVAFVRHRNKQIRNARTVVIEVRFQEAKQATAFRKDFVNKVKELHKEGQLAESELSGLSTYPVQTLATRVRAALLKSMAKTIEEVMGPNITAYCQQYLTRPLLKIVNKQGDSTNIQSYGFVDSVMKLKWHNDLHRVALGDAYQVAGSKFGGTLEQHFIILKRNRV